MATIEYLKTRTFRVQNYDRVSLPALCNQLYDILTIADPIEPNVPVAITLLYGLNAQAWRQSKFTAPGWHMSLPSAFASLNAIGGVLGASKFCTEGQIVAGNVVKYPTDDKTNVVELDVHELSAPVKRDAPRFEHKLLIWYLDQCALRSKRPSYTEYNNTLEKLRRKRKAIKENSKELFELAAKAFGDKDPFK